MLLTLGTPNSRAGTAAQACTLRALALCPPDANDFRQFEQRLRETGSVTPTAHVNAGRPQTVRTPANDDAIIAGVEKLTQYPARIGTIPTEGP
jgi:hypothetical protein